MSSRSRRTPRPIGATMSTARYFSPRATELNTMPSLLSNEVRGILMRPVIIALLAIFSAALAAAQARPFPGPDVQQIYNRLLPQIEKIPAFDHHAHPGYFDD